MNKFEKWQDLRRQTREARHEKDKKYTALITCEWNTKEKSCVQVYSIQSVGVPNEEQSNDNFTTRFCNSFSHRITCTDQFCPMRLANADYVLANLKFRALRADRRRAFWAMFQRSK